MKLVQVAVLSALFLAFVFSFALPEPALAGPLDGPLVPTCFASQNGGFIGACQLCDLVSLARNLINFSIAFSVIAATLLFAYAGFMYYTAASSPENIKKAHGIFTKTLGGIVLILAAWLVVDILMQTITGGTWALSRDIQCLSYPRGASLPPRPVQGGAGATGTGTRQCNSPTNGLCSVSSMGGFGDQANQAAAVCLAESGAANRPTRRTDILVNDPQRRLFSFGLFQINATVHRLTAPECTPSGRGVHECPSAFACPNNAERCNSNQKLIVNEDVYNRCKQSLEVAACNIATAQQIWGAAGRNFSTDWTAARTCGIR
ncbi:hypothetical protein K2P56_02005 [Patescibacteria group bacterium]|nr:hypothetical protein [Patescibacteria group bacterium]